MKLEMIEWVDSCGCEQDWKEVAEMNSVPIVCFSVGWVVSEDDSSVMIAPHRAEGDSQWFCGQMTIPTKSINSRVPLGICGQPHTADAEKR